MQAVLGLVEDDAGAGLEDLAVGVDDVGTPDPRVPKLLDPGANHPQKGDDTPGRFEKAELGGGSYGTGHTGAAGVTQ
jgi:hypothetical protein